MEAPRPRVSPKQDTLADSDIKQCDGLAGSTQKHPLKGQRLKGLIKPPKGLMRPPKILIRSLISL